MAADPFQLGLLHFVTFSQAQTEECVETFVQHIRNSGSSLALAVGSSASIIAMVYTVRAYIYCATPSLE